MGRTERVPERYTLEEFALIEQDAPEGERWELINGHIVRMMTGGTIGHNRIVQNFVVATRSALRRNDLRCDVFSENVKFEQANRETATYPDVIVTCEKTDNDKLAVKAPVLVAEVLSKTSVARDRIEKWHEYSAAPSLNWYVVIEQRQPRIEVYGRHAEGANWVWSTWEGLGGELAFPDLGITIPVAEIYDRVFEAGSSAG